MSCEVRLVDTNISYMQNQDLRKTDMDVEESPGRERSSKRGQEKAMRREMIKECHMHT